MGKSLVRFDKAKGSVDPWLLYLLSLTPHPGKPEMRICWQLDCYMGGRGTMRTARRLSEERNRMNKSPGRNRSLRLFVGNLTLRIEEKDLLALFESIGQINSIRVMTDEGVSRGFAFVEMTSEQEMVKAITKLNGKELDGHLLRVRAD
jgi:hypothetical protein